MVQVTSSFPLFDDSVYVPLPGHTGTGPIADRFDRVVVYAWPGFPMGYLYLYVSSILAMARMLALQSIFWALSRALWYADTASAMSAPAMSSVASISITVNPLLAGEN